MTISVSTLRPGLLVSIKTSIKGNVEYLKTEGETFIRDDGSEYAEWETERTIKDPAEQKRATEVRGKARNLITGVCAASEFGLLCPEDKRADLEAAFDKARALCAEFNATSRVTRVKFNAIAGRIAPDDLEAVRAINGEVRELLSEMTEGIEGLDVERVRDAAARAKKLGSMLSDEAQGRIKDAISAARAQAKKIVEAGEQAATVIDAETINKLAAARTAFLDIDEAAEVQAPEDTSGRALDLAPHTDPAAPAAAPTPELELSDILS